MCFYLCSASRSHYIPVKPIAAPVVLSIVHFQYDLRHARDKYSRLRNRYRDLLPLVLQGKQFTLLVRRIAIRGLVMQQVKQEFEVFTGLAGERRIRKAEYVLPIVVGTCAFSLGKKAIPDQQTHRWHVYVRGPACEDLSPVIKKVVFHLHPTFPNPHREVTQHPFEIEESGWGEFDIQISIHFQDDAQEPPVDITHKLKLYGDSENVNSKKPVQSERYEELVFVEPAEAFFNRIAGIKLQLGQPLSAIHHLFKEPDPQQDLQRITEARHKIAKAMASMTSKN